MKTFNTQKKNNLFKFFREVKIKAIKPNLSINVRAGYLIPPEANIEKIKIKVYGRIKKFMRLFGIF